MTRLERRDRDDIIFKGCGGLMDIFDDAVKGVWRINDEEYDYICEHCSDEELELVVNERPTFTQARQALTIVNKMVEECRNSTI